MKRLLVVLVAVLIAVMGLPGLGIGDTSAEAAGPIGESGYGVMAVNDSVIGPSSGIALWGGDLFVGEGFLPGFSNQSVVKLSPAEPGAVKTTYGVGFNLPDEIAFRADGVLFVVDRYATIPGIYTIPPGGGEASLFVNLTEVGLIYPTGIAFGPDGFLYVEDVSSDNVTGFVKKFDSFTPASPIATLTDPFPGPGTHGTILEGLTFDSSGKWYLARQDISQVDIYDPITGEWTYFTSLLMDEPIGIAVGPGPYGSGEFVYLANWHTVTRSTLDGETVQIASGLLNGMGVAVDASGTIFVGDNSGNAIYAITPPIKGVPVFPNWYAMMAAVVAAGGLGYLIWRRRLLKRG